MGGIVTAGTGAGGISSAMSSERTKAVAKGVWFVSTTRTGSGSSYGDGTGVIAGGDLTAVKSRLLLILSRAFTTDFEEAKGWFTTFGGASFGQAEAAETVPAEPGSTSVRFTSTATSSCDGKAPELTVALKNIDDVAIDVRVVSPAGEYKFTKVGPGKTVERTFTPKGKTLAGGEATLTAYKYVNGGGVQTVSTSAYAAVDCKTK